MTVYPFFQVKSLSFSNKLFGADHRPFCLFKQVLCCVMRKILIADDHSLFSSGMSALFVRAGYEVVGTVEKGNDVLYEVITHHPDILILDLNLPKKNGLEVLKEVRAYSRDLIILVVTMYNDRTLINSVRKEGANGYFLKNSDQTELLEAASKLKPGDFMVSVTVENSNSADPSDLVEDEFDRLIKLTVREKEILKLLVQGLSSKEIGEYLEISPSTVDTHRKNMLKKLSFNKVSELVSYAFRNNLV